MYVDDILVCILTYTWRYIYSITVESDTTEERTWKFELDKYYTMQRDEEYRGKVINMIFDQICNYMF